MAKNRQFVLLVGEEQQEREVLKQALERDYRLVCVNRGDQALEIAHTRPPDIILLFKMCSVSTGKMCATSWAAIRTPPASRS